MKTTKAQAFEAGDIVALTFGSPEEEAKYIAEVCRSLHGVAIKEDGIERGMAWSDMAVLLRSVRRDAGPITAALKAAGIPYVITGMNKLFEKAEAEAARQLFYFLAGEDEFQSISGRPGKRQTSGSILAFSIAQSRPPSEPGKTWAMRRPRPVQGL